MAESNGEKRKYFEKLWGLSKCFSPYFCFWVKLCQLLKLRVEKKLKDQENSMTWALWRIQALQHNNMAASRNFRLVQPFYCALYRSSEPYARLLGWDSSLKIPRRNKMIYYILFSIVSIFHTSILYWWYLSALTRVWHCGHVLGTISIDLDAVFFNL